MYISPAISIYLMRLNIFSQGVKNMECQICGKSTLNEKYCDRCDKIMEKVIREVGPDVWEKIDDCKYIYPMVKRVAEGDLRIQDVVNELIKGEAD